MVDPRVEPLTQQLLRDGYFDCESDAKRAATRILLASEDVFDDPPEFPAQSAINEP
jgi:hypothetical protein